MQFLDKLYDKGKTVDSLEPSIEQENEEEENMHPQVQNSADVSTIG